MSGSKVHRPDYATATDVRVVQNREALKAALLELLAGKTLEEVTIREIAATAGIGYTTFFRHYRSKEELLDQIAAAEIGELFALTLPCLDPDDPGASSLALCSFVADHRVLWKRLLTGGAGGRLREEFLRLTREFAHAHGARHEWLPPEVGVLLGASGTLELLTWWLQENRPIPVEQLALIHERLVVRPLLLSAGDDAT